MSPDCRQLYIVIVAKPYAWLQEPSRSRSVVIFIKYREVSTRTILPNFIDLSPETVLSSRFGGHKGGVARGRRGRRGSVRLHLIPLANQGDSPEQLRRFSRAAKKVLARSHNRSLQLQAGPDTRTEFEISQRSLKGGGEAGRAHHCRKCKPELKMRSHLRHGPLKIGKPFNTGIGLLAHSAEASAHLLHPALL